MARRRRTTRLERVEAVAVDTHGDVETLKRTVRRLDKRIRALEADEAKDAIGFQHPQDDEDPDVEEMP